MEFFTQLFCTRHARARWGPGLAVSCLLLLFAGPLHAGGGPRNVLVVANENSEESLEIANYYARARQIPDSNFCRVRTSTSLTVDSTVYRNEIEVPIQACIDASPHRDRIDYIVLTRGFPIRASFPDPSSPPTTPVSTTALLQVMDTAIQGKDQEYGEPYRFQFFPNPYRGRSEYFSHTKTFGTYNLYISTMLSGFWTSDALALVDRSLASDGNPPTDVPGATFILEDANGAANVRNSDFPTAASNLQTAGYQAQHLASGEEATGMVVASHVTGGVYSGNNETNIHSNTWPPGAIVDVLESFGLVPNNFVEDGSYSQVPVTWWIAAGATGGHGTVFEPYNVAFPNGYMLEPYIVGYNLGETFYQGIPYLYWMNLVLGDPLAAPWATKPVVTIESPAPDTVVSGTVQIQVSASTPFAGGIQQIEVFVGDTLVDTINGGSGQARWNTGSFPDGPHRVEAIAYEASSIYTQGQASQWLIVDNGGLSLDITDPAPDTRVSGNLSVTVDASPGIQEVSLTAEGLPLGTVAGTSPFMFDVDTSLLGRGWHTLQATGSSGAGEAVSDGVRFWVEKSPRVWNVGGVPRLNPNEGPGSGGTAVAIEGWNFEPGIQVSFGGSAATNITVIDPNHLEATTPPGVPGAVDVVLTNPLGGQATLAGAFNYLAAPCPVTSPVENLRVRQLAGSGQTELSWDPLVDPCLDGYRVFTFENPSAQSVPVFPDDFEDITALDEDGDVGSAPGFLYPAPSIELRLLLVAGTGTDGSTGPR